MERMAAVVAARRGDSRDEWIVALWHVWPARRGNVHQGPLWEEVQVFARVPTPDGNVQDIERAHALARFIAESEGLDQPAGGVRTYPAWNHEGRRVRVTVPDYGDGF